MVQESYDSLLDNAPDARSRARLLAVATNGSGAWLHALSISAVGLRMGDDVIRIATGLRLGVPICRPHHCQHCYAEVDELGLHGLSCVKSAGRHFRHAAVNSIVQMSLASAKIPSMLALMSSAAVVCHSTIWTSIVTLTQGMCMNSPCTCDSPTHTYII